MSVLVRELFNKILIFDVTVPNRISSEILQNVK